MNTSQPIAWGRMLSTFSAMALVGVGLVAACSPDAETKPGEQTPVLCGGEAAEPVLRANGEDSGLVRCPDDTLFRQTAASCEPTVGEPSCVGDEDNRSCESDADCTAEPNGRCVSGLTVGGGTSISYCWCGYPGCATDADCEPEEACMCAGMFELESPRCVLARCRVNDDCPSGECGLSMFNNGCGASLMLACRSAADSCRIDADCPDDQHECEISDGAMIEDDTDAWKCRRRSCIR